MRATTGPRLHVIELLDPGSTLLAMKQACGRCGKWFAMEHDGEGDGAPDDITSPWVFPAHQSRGTVRAIGQDVTTSSECGGSGRNEWESHNAV